VVAGEQHNLTPGPLRRHPELVVLALHDEHRDADSIELDQTVRGDCPRLSCRRL
jgi:hypothetical protein